MLSAALPPQVIVSARRSARFAKPVKSMQNFSEISKSNLLDEFYKLQNFKRNVNECFFLKWVLEIPRKTSRGKNTVMG